MTHSFPLKRFAQSSHFIIALLAVILLVIITTSAPAQSGSWSGTSFSGVTGYQDHGNGVIQLLDTNNNGCSASALHRLNEYTISSGTAYSACFQTFFGCPGNDEIGSDTKGDGLAFSFWEGTIAEYDMNNGACGGGLGYDRARPKMITVEFDTWSSQGLWDFDGGYEGTGIEDQVAIHYDGIAMATNKLAGANPGNLEDGFEHDLCINYDPGTTVLQVSIDGNIVLQYNLGSTGHDFATYFDTDNLNITWSSGKFGATNPATVTDGADISNTVGPLCGIPSAMVLVDGNNFCPGDSALLYIDQPFADYSYQWYRNGIAITTMTQADSVHYATEAGTYSVMVEFQGHDNTSNQVSVQTLTPTSQAIAGNNININEGQSAQLAGNSPGAGETGTWSGGNGTFNPDAQTPNATYTPTQQEIDNELVQLTWTITGPSCPSTQDVVDIVIALNPPDVAINAAGTDFCPGDSTLLSVDTPSAEYNYQWFNNGIPVTTLASTNTSIYATTAGTYTAMAEENGRTSTSNPIVIQVLPSTSQAIAGNNININEGQSAQLAGNSPGASETGTWSGGNGAFSPDAQTPNATYTPTQQEIDSELVQLTWTITGPSCPSTQDVVDIIIALNPSDVTINAAGTDICPGDSTLLTVDAPSATYNYQWFINGSPVTTLATTNTSLYATTAGSYTAMAEEDGRTTTSNPIVIQVLPSTSQATAGNDINISEGQNAQLAGNTPGGSETAAWSGGNGTFSPDAQTPNATYTPTLQEQIDGSVQLTWTINGPSCPSTEDMVNIFISSTPLDVSISTNDNDICPGDSTMLTAGPFDASYTYEWLLDGNTIVAPTAGNNSIWVATAGQYQVVIDKQTTQDTSIVLEVLALSLTNPIEATATSGNPGNLCAGDEITLSSNPDGTVNQITWSAINGTGFISNANASSATYIVPTGDQGSIGFAIEAQGTCNTVYDTAYMDIAPNIDLSFEVITDSVCPGQTAQVQLTGNTGTGPFSLDYTFNGIPGNASVNDGHVFDFPISTPTTVTFGQVAGQYGCTADLSTSVNLYTYNDLTLPTSFPVDTFACQGNNLTLDAGSFAQYNWSTGENTRTIDLLVDQSLTVLVTVTDDAGCTAEQAVNVADAPLPQLTDQESTVCTGSSATFEAASGYAGYLWSDGTATASATFDTPGQYNVTVTSNLGCQASASATLIHEDQGTLSLAGVVTEICDGEAIELSVEVSGAAQEYAIDLTLDNTQITTIDGLNPGTNNISIVPGDPLYPSASSILTLSASSASRCAPLIDPNGQQLPITFRSSPAVSGQDMLICSDNDPQDLIYTLTGSDLYDITYTVNGALEAANDVPGPEFVLEDAEQGTYAITNITGSNGCSTSPTTGAEVRVDKNIISPIDMEYTAQPSCEGIAITIESVSNADDYQWTFGNGQTSTAQYPPVQYFADSSMINIQLEVSNVLGCTDELVLDQQNINIQPEALAIPNIFTPGNVDGYNDYLTLDPNEFYDGCIQFRVYNRWGVTIFENTTDLTLDTWDGNALTGEPAPAGTYYYTYQIGDGEVSPSSVTLIR